MTREKARDVLRESYEKEIVERFDNAAKEIKLYLSSAESGIRERIRQAVPGVIFDEVKSQQLLDMPYTMLDKLKAVEAEFQDALASLLEGKPPSPTRAEKVEKKKGAFTDDDIKKKLAELATSEKGISGSDITDSMGLPRKPYGWTIGGHLSHMKKRGELPAYEFRNNGWYLSLAYPRDASAPTEGESALPGEPEKYKPFRQTLYLKNLNTHGFLKRLYDDGRVDIGTNYKYTGSKGYRAASEIAEDIKRMMSDAGIEDPEISVGARVGVGKGFKIRLGKRTWDAFKKAYEMSDGYGR